MIFVGLGYGVRPFIIDNKEFMTRTSRLFYIYYYKTNKNTYIPINYMYIMKEGKPCMLYDSEYYKNTHFLPIYTEKTVKLWKEYKNIKNIYRTEQEVYNEYCLEL